jgi:hypothetical protein
MARDDSDPIAEIIGDYRAFAAMRRCSATASPMGSLRPPAAAARTSREGEPRGRLGTGIPPVHRRVYRTGLEHLGVVVGDEFNDFDGFRHVDDWVPQQLVTATGPDPLPRLTRRS